MSTMRYQLQRSMQHTLANPSIWSWNQAEFLDHNKYDVEKTKKSHGVDRNSISELQSKFGEKILKNKRDINKSWYVFFFL